MPTINNGPRPTTRPATAGKGASVSTPSSSNASSTARPATAGKGASVRPGSATTMSPARPSTAGKGGRVSAFTVPVTVSYPVAANPSALMGPLLAAQSQQVTAMMMAFNPMSIWMSMMGFGQR